MDSAREQVLVPATEAKHLARGNWSHTDAGVQIRNPDASGTMNYWLASAKDAWLGDGLVRARIHHTGSVHATVLLRANVDPSQLEAISTLGLQLWGDKIAFMRWDKGLGVPVGETLRVSGLSRHTQLEVVVWLTGPQIIALVFDGNTFEQLASLALRDSTYSGGFVGMRVYPRKDKGSRLALLTIMPQGAGWWGAAPIEETHPLGVHRFALLDPKDKDAIPKHLKGVILGPWTHKQTEHLAVLVKPTELEQLKRRGIHPQHMAEHIPFWAKAKNYRKWRDKPPQKTARGYRLDLSYKDAHMVEALLKGYAKRYPHITKLVELGRTHQNRPLWGMRISDHPKQDENEPAILLNAGHHGSELLSIEYGLDAIAVLVEGYSTDSRIRHWVDSLDIWVVPLVNPDGNLRVMLHNEYSGRKNGRDGDGDGERDSWEGVDLNRNYPFQWGALGERGSRSFLYSAYYRGAEPGSEPETQAMMALAQRHRFVASISWHTNGTMILAPYTIDNVRNPVPNEAWTIAEDIAKVLPVQPNHKRYVVRRNMYAVDGTDQDWLRHTFGTVAYIVEGSHHNTLSASIRKASVVATRPIFTTLLDRVLNGPRIQGHTVNSNGQPIEATITIDSLATRAGERWTSRPRDGRFDRLVPGNGPYLIRASARGYQATEKQIDVSGTTSDVRLILSRKTRQKGVPTHRIE